MGPAVDGYEVPVSSVLLTLKLKNGKTTQKDLDDAKAFALKHLVNAQYEITEHFCRCNDKDKLQGMLNTLDSKRFEYELISNYLETGERGAKDRHLIIEKMIGSILERLSLHNINQMFAEDSEAPGEPLSQKIKRETSWKEALLDMPEWLQVLTHHYGLYITPMCSDQNSPYAAACLGDRTAPGILALYISPRVINPEDLHTALLEELIHELQLHADFYNFNNVYGANEEWQKAFKALTDAMDKNPLHPALALIHKVKSLGSTAMVSEFHEFTPLRGAELMVDMYHVEAYLRNTEHKSKDDTEAELRKAFGDDVYEIAQKHVQLWMNQAQAILAENIGADKANKHRTEWEKSPFTHEIKLPLLEGQYSLSGVGMDRR